jgi:parvulin-like peptidyl-prolyl isomerase
VDERGQALRALAVLAPLALGAGCQRERPDPVVVALGDEVVHRSDFERHLQTLERDGPLEADVRRAVFDSFAEERLLVLEARRRQLLAAGAGEDEEREAVQRLLADAAATPAVTDAEITSFYEERRADFNLPETVTLHQILVPSPNEALDVLRRLQADPTSFEAIARSQSRGPEAGGGGGMGGFARGQLPAELEAAAFALAVAQVSQPIQTPLGYHVLRLDARQPARARTLAECREEIRNALQRQRTDQAVKSFVQDLMAKAKVNHEAAEVAGRPS